MIALFIRSHWRRREGTFLVSILGLVALSSLGPILHIAGQRLVTLPWRLVLFVPVINNALPGRFSA